MSLTLEQMRADIARITGLPVAEVGDDDDLSDLGLDSLRVMRLVLDWEAAGARVDFGQLAEYATLGDWWREVVAPQTVG